MSMPFTTKPSLEAPCRLGRHEPDADSLRKKLAAAGLTEIEVVHGSAGTVRVATHPDVDFVVSAIVGVSGLEATYEAVKAGKTVGLANKECLVVAGELITAEARRQGKPLLPIDSEHNAIHQCLRGGRMHEVERIWLTASGGPFLHTPKSEFASITVEQALNHPTWKMGRRITIDSATLMNKGFEVIEACRLSTSRPSQVQRHRASPIYHPFHGRIRGWQHACSNLRDGHASAHPVCADLPGSDPIRSALPGHGPAASRLSARRIWTNSLVCVWLTRQRQPGGSKTIALNAADEVAVAAFLDEQIGFDDIPRIIEDVLTATPAADLESIKAVLNSDT
jgi:1-deoxy-D-xylulose-5-phosphate reductoisomerase